MSGVERFSTADLGARQRIEYWNHLAAETFPGSSVDQREAAFDAEMLRWRVGDLSLVRPWSKAAVVNRAGQHGPERLLLHIAHRGRGIHRQCGRTNVIGRGDLVLCTTVAPYQMEMLEHDLLIVDLPRAMLEERVPRLDEAVARVIPAGLPGSRMLHDFYLSLWRNGDLSVVDPNWQAGAAEVLVDLVALAIRGQQLPSPRPDSLRERAVRLIEDALCEPDLGSSQIADALGVSVRTVQNVFAAMGTTPGAYVLTRRVARAAEMLTVNPDLSVTEVAFDLGFNDSSYFARCFRRILGVAPSQWRVRGPLQ